ncbi:MAG: hypothetical protein Q7J68_01775 [Thermoplasmata archaeon]|nr:hypothetical protein [Thermoplasmata archaeon]
MIKAIAFLAIFGSLVFLGTGGIFIIAGGSDNVLIGGASIGIGLLLLLITYFLVREEAKRPIKQNINVTLSGSGEFRQRVIQCPKCGAPVKDENVKMIDGGLLITCPFCENVWTLEEEPKW